MDRFQEENAFHRIDGYWATPHAPTLEKMEIEFLRAQKEVAKYLHAMITDVHALSFRRFIEISAKRGRGCAAEYDRLVQEKTRGGVA